MDERRRGNVVFALLSTRVIISAMLCAVACSHEPAPLASNQETRTVPLVDQKTTRVVIREDEDDPNVWDAVGAFEKLPSNENTKAVFRILEEKLDDWGSHPAGVVTSILEAIGEHRVANGRPYLIAFMRGDPTLKGAHFVQGTAARVLGRLGKRDDLKELENTARRGPENVLSAVAIALGTLGDHGAVAPLEDLASHSSSRVRARAFSALAKYCGKTTRPLALQAIRDADDGVRWSVTSWIATCGTPDDASALLGLLSDPNELVRLNALKGLTRMRSTLACGSTAELQRDISPSVRQAASNYGEICKTE